MKIFTIMLLLVAAFSAQAAETVTDCRDYDGGLRVEAERLEALSRSENQGKAVPDSQGNSSAPVDANAPAKGENHSLSEEN